MREFVAGANKKSVLTQTVMKVQIIRKEHSFTDLIRWVGIR